MILSILVVICAAIYCSFRFESVFNFWDRYDFIDGKHNISGLLPTRWLLEFVTQMLVDR